MLPAVGSRSRLKWRTSVDLPLPDSPIRALVFGTGGSAKAVCAGLDRLGIPFGLVSRRTGDGLLSYDRLTAEHLQKHMLLINCTPLGLPLLKERSSALIQGAKSDNSHLRLVSQLWQKRSTNPSPSSTASACWKRPGIPEFLKSNSRSLRTSST